MTIYKLLPIEATDVMLNAPLRDEGDVHLLGRVVSGKVYESRRDLRPLIWRTMAAAAPSVLAQGDAATIVAWLRASADHPYAAEPWITVARAVASKIERGEHLKPPPDATKAL